MSTWEGSSLNKAWGSLGCAKSPAARGGLGGALNGVLGFNPGGRFWWVAELQVSSDLGSGTYAPTYPTAMGPAAKLMPSAQWGCRF